MYFSKTKEAIVTLRNMKMLAAVVSTENSVFIRSNWTNMNLIISRFNTVTFFFFFLRGEGGFLMKQTFCLDLYLNSMNSTIQLHPSPSFHPQLWTTKNFFLMAFRFNANILCATMSIVFFVVVHFFPWLFFSVSTIHCF